MLTGPRCTRPDESTVSSTTSPSAAAITPLVTWLSLSTTATASLKTELLALTKLVMPSDAPPDAATSAAAITTLLKREMRFIWECSFGEGLGVFRPHTLSPI